MRVGLAAVLLGACSFHAPAMFQPDDGGRPPDGPIVDSVADDATIGADAAVVDASPPPDAAPGFCDPDPDLVACWTFDGNAVDFSGHGHDATTALVAYVP